MKDSTGTILKSYVSKGVHWNRLAPFVKVNYHMPHVLEIQMKQAEQFKVKWFQS